LRFSGDGIRIEVKYCFTFALMVKVLAPACR
jgi:hypothetical protein